MDPVAPTVVLQLPCFFTLAAFGSLEVENVQIDVLLVVMATVFIFNLREEEDFFVLPLAQLCIVYATAILGKGSLHHVGSKERMRAPIAFILFLKLPVGDDRTILSASGRVRRSMLNVGALLLDQPELLITHVLAGVGAR